jgi:hypothetical protein
LSLEAEKIQIECLNNKFVFGLSLVVSNVYLCLIERGLNFVFIAFSDKSCWAEKEPYLSVCDPTNIDQAKNQQSFTGFVYKNANKILPSRMSNFSGRRLIQVASNMVQSNGKLVS